MKNTVSSPQAARFFETDAITPCRTRVAGDRDLWFTDRRDRIHAVRACQACPFIGRCGYNAVAQGATHGVWGGLAFSGSLAPGYLHAAYTYLLEQFQRRCAHELGDQPRPPLPRLNVHRPVSDEASAAVA